MASSSARKRVPSEERVFSLVLALVASPQGLTKSELLSSVYGYAERYDPRKPDPAIERQFERDKTQLRELGIPIETIDSPLEAGNNQLSRYRIVKDRLQLPEQVRFSAEELTLLKMASLAWRDGSLDSASRWASMKLVSLGVNLDVRNLGIAPSLGMREAAAVPLQAAIDERKIVRFDYRLPNRETALERRVAPLRLHRAEGRWHLVAHDLDRSAERIFLLTRITSEVRIEQQEFDAALLSRAQEALDNMLKLVAQQRAIVRVQRGSTAEARLEPRGSVISGGADTPESAVQSGSSDPARELGEGVHIELGTLDYSVLASEIAGFGDEAVVVEPETLRAETTRLLETIREQHSGAADG
ncbi:WYL domain-containing protein [Leucobacter sp. UT-8R-CII-1-4]|uniref:helix-turn-helix transcriptional regulator n=1 Tax=Leucobacter sp. UT-8R-CII-1-4 TaxID=3040075 RepID=UPI0024A8E799|nr:WYL domain-containing protein [Leucobacter sp. UT-8R-CII-1-4]MDI6024330.1 WYL domain-containing protein [Leucobacter sp. UT-8R-CII-1-4]